MGNFTQTDQARYHQVRKLAEVAYAGLVQKVVAAIKGFPPEARQGGDDSVLSNSWEEFKFQHQVEEFDSFEILEEVIRATCAGVLRDFDRTKKGVLWLWTDGFMDWNDTDGEIPFDDPVNDALEQELYKRVCRAACDEDLLVDPDEGRRREAADLESAYFAQCRESSSPTPTASSSLDQSLSAVSDRLLQAGLRALDEHNRCVPRTNSRTSANDLHGANACVCLGADAASAIQMIDTSREGRGLIHGSHFSVCIQKCPQCAQQFLRVFTEQIDWDEGDDSQDWRYVPITQEEVALLLADKANADESFLQNLVKQRRYLLESHPTGRLHEKKWLEGTFWIPPHD